jgi:hypothetical protein
MKLQEAIERLTVPQVKKLRNLIPISDRSTIKSEIAGAIARYLLSADLGSIWEQLSEREHDSPRVHRSGSRLVQSLD